MSNPRTARSLALPFLPRRPQTQEEWVAGRLAQTRRRLGEGLGVPLGEVSVQGVPSPTLDTLGVGEDRWRQRWSEDPWGRSLEGIRGLLRSSGVDGVTLSERAGEGPRLEARAVWDEEWDRDWLDRAGGVLHVRAALEPAGVDERTTEVYQTLLGDGWGAGAALEAAIRA